MLYYTIQDPKPSFTNGDLQPLNDMIKITTATLE